MFDCDKISFDGLTQTFSFEAVFNDGSNQQVNNLDVFFDN